MTNPEERYFMLSYHALRVLTGCVGLLMPIAVRGIAWLCEGIHSTDSISAYYYTCSRDVFVSSLALVGVLLACYRTAERIDTRLSFVAGVSAIGIGLFPMDPTYAPEIIEKYPTLLEPPNYLNIGPLGYHFIFVAVFFATTFWMVFFRFRALTPAQPTRQKLTRNRIYFWCGLGMLLSFAVIGFLALTRSGASIFWPEAAAVLCFTVAWLVKGQLILADPKPAAAAAGLPQA